MNTFIAIIPLILFFAFWCFVIWFIITLVLSNKERVINPSLQALVMVVYFLPHGFLSLPLHLYHIHVIDM